jgi:uroporphyrinogen decarboxylase
VDETPRDTVRRAFRFEQTRPVPYYIPMEAEVERRIVSLCGRRWLEVRLVPYLFLKHCGFGKTPVEGELSRDAFGTVTREGNISHVVHHPLASPSLRGYTWPRPESMDDWHSLARLYKAQPLAYRLCGFGYGLFERSWLMRGMENILVDMISAPEFVDDLLDGITEIHLSAMDLIVRAVPIEAYFGGDDWCDQKGPIMGIDLWRRFFKPRLARLVAHCHDLGLPYVAHSCGNLLPLVDDLVDIGMDGLESLQPEAMDLAELKRRTRGRMVLIGGLGVQNVLPFGTPGEVRAQTDWLVHAMGAGGGYALAPAKPLLPDTPLENAIAFIEAASSQEVAS